MRCFASKAITTANARPGGFFDGNGLSPSSEGAASPFVIAVPTSLTAPHRGPASCWPATAFGADRGKKPSSGLPMGRAWKRGNVTLETLRRYFRSWRIFVPGAVSDSNIGADWPQHGRRPGSVQACIWCQRAIARAMKLVCRCTGCAKSLPC